MEALTMEAATVRVGQATGTPCSLSRIQGSPRTGRGDRLAQLLRTSLGIVGVWLLRSRRLSTAREGSPHGPQARIWAGR